MAYSYIRYTGNGSTTNFAFSFPYLSADHISVRVNDVVTAFTFLNSSTVTVSPAPANSAVVEVRRNTPIDNPIVDFADGSVLLEGDLDLLARYSLYVAQEANDAAEATLGQNGQGNWDALNKRLVNLADPVGAQDAVTKLWAETATTSVLAQTQAVLNEFQSIYHGARTTAPTVNVSTGDLWFDTGVTPSSLRIYNGSTWQRSNAIGSSRNLFTATAGQTQFIIPSGYSAGQVDVFLNGVKLVDGDDFTATDGQKVVLTSGAALNDTLEVISAVTYFVGINDVVSREAFTGNGSTTAFATTRALVNDASVNISINGVVQHGDAYSVSGSTITFSAAPPVNSKIDVVIFGGTPV